MKYLNAVKAKVYKQTEGQPVKQGIRKCNG